MTRRPARPPRRRVWRTAAYTLMGAAGVASMVWPAAPAVRHATAGAGSMIYIWAALLILGGACSAAGAWTDRWLGEYAGLGPLISVFVVYGLASFVSDRGFASYAGGFTLLAIAAFLLARWHDVAQIREEAARQTDRS